MPKIILEFDSVTEREEAKLAQNAGAYQSVVHDLDNLLRSTTKHNQPILSAKEIPNVSEEHLRDIEWRIAELLRTKISELCNEYEVSTW